MSTLIPADKSFDEHSLLDSPKGGNEAPLGEGGSSLDSSVHKWRNLEPWERRRKRLYQRAMSGIELALSKKQKIRFLSLTSGPEAKDELIHEHFRALVKRIRYYYPEFEYLSVKEETIAGKKHLHILYKGAYLPQKWVSAQWKELHQSPIVHITIFRGSPKRASSYICKYIGKDPSSARYWCSWKWVFRGFVRAWRAIVAQFRDRAVDYWRYCLWYGHVDRLKQETLAVNGPPRVLKWAPE